MVAVTAAYGHSKPSSLNTHCLVLQDANSKDDVLLHTIEIARGNNREDFRTGQDLINLTMSATENGKLLVSAAGEEEVCGVPAMLMAASPCSML